MNKINKEAERLFPRDGTLLYNAIQSQKQEAYILGATHSTYQPTEQEIEAEAYRRFPLIAKENNSDHVIDGNSLGRHIFRDGCSFMSGRVDGDKLAIEFAEWAFLNYTYNAETGWLIRGYRAEDKFKTTAELLHQFKTKNNENI